MIKKIVSKKTLKQAGVLIVLINLFALNVMTVQAAPFLDSFGCAKEGECTLNDFVKLFIAASKVILGLSGSAALLFFVIGGLMFLTSAGSQERVTKGKSMISGAALGLIIVFLSYTIIGFVLKTLGVSGDWFKTSWF